MNKMQFRQLKSNDETIIHYKIVDNISHAESIGIELDDGAVDMIVDRYVEQGDYDCNLNYWANIENLIKEEGGNKNEN